MSSFRLIDSAGGLEEAARSLSKTLDENRNKGARTRLFIDTEFESNRSGTTICLLQISAGEEIFLIDPFAIKRVEPLARVVEQKDVEWVLHAGLQDVQLVADFLHIRPPQRLFDTQIAWGLISPESSVSLAYLQFKILGIRSEKTHQADDWVRRPLQASQLRYAASDVDYLPGMQDYLLEEAEKLDRTEHIFRASYEALCPVRPAPTPVSLSSFRNAWQLSERSQACLRFIITWYNALVPRERRHAPEGKVLLSIANRCPTDVSSLGRIKGVSPSVVQHHGKALVDGMKAAMAGAQSADFVPLDPPPYGSFEDIQLDAWLAAWRAHLAITLKFAPELVLPGRLMKDIKANLVASGVQGIADCLVDYRAQLLGPESTKFCESQPPPV